MQNKTKAFTLIEILIIVALIAFLAGMVILIVSPGERREAARDDQRKTHLESIYSATRRRQIMLGGWPVTGTCEPLPQEEFELIGTEHYDLFSCLVPGYLADPLYDPEQGSPENSGYEIMQSPETGGITLRYYDEEREKEILAGVKDY